VGGNNLSTEYSGVIRDGASGIGGSLTKAGTGTLTLSGDNTFTGLTTVLAGKLIMSGSLAGAVNVQGGVLGGNGDFNGGITVGPGGAIEPGASIGAFNTLGALSFGTGSAYGLEIDSTAGTADTFSAVNVTIGTGVNLFGNEIGSGFLPLGMQFKIIDNTSPNPTMGTFAGLAEGAQLPIGINLFQISYTGGDGNDVTLTNLVPEPASISTIVLGAGLLSFRRRRLH
jgi:autotransporter-associated beta strand protein